VSGLVARFHRDSRPIDTELVWAMLNAAPYRGPDGMSIRTWEQVALGFAKMAITPEEADEQQPLLSPRSGCAIIADVRLDNRDELLAQLPEQPAADISDADLILRAYETWGVDCAAKLLGDFAWAIWDPREMRMVCARDTSGQRALFYYLDHATFTAASEIHQILQDPALPVEPNEDRILTMLTPQNMVQNEKQVHETFYKDIYLIPAGHVLVVTPNDYRMWRYWELEPIEIRYRDDREYVDHFRDLFFEVVRARLRSTHPMGALLSGGLDSSSVVCTAQEIFREEGTGGDRLMSMSHVFDGLDCDERPLIETIRDKYDMDTRFIEFDGSGGRLHLEPHCFLESPMMGFQFESNPMLEPAIAKGARVVLTGEVADACVMGSWIVFDSLLKQRRLRELHRLAREYHQTIGTSWPVIALYTLGPLLPLQVQKQATLMYTRPWLKRHQHDFGPKWMPEPLRAELTRRVFDLALEENRSRRFANETRHREYNLLYPPEVSRSQAPWPIETWRPFADRRLHQFLLGIPPEQKFATQVTGEAYGRSKWLLRRAMIGVLPEDIRQRTTKTVFSQSRTPEIERNWSNYEAVFGPTGQSEIAQRGYITPDRFWNRLQQARANPAMSDMTYVMQMMGLETWLRSFRLPRNQITTIPFPQSAASSPTGTMQVAGVV
jgi:asparagine synthase (glutamine-hydrolysing)